jgi:uncharacterized protein YjbI with pentapeptide repeats
MLTLALTIPCHAFNKVKTIENLIQMAEVEFLDSDLTKAGLTYKAITNLALDEVWPKHIRANIFQSYFRLAQLDKNQEVYWIKKAIVYAPDLKPNLDLTPPNLVQLFEEQCKKQNYINLDQSQSELSDKFKVLINSSESMDKVVSDKIYRLDFIKDGLAHHTFFVGGESIAGFSLKQKLKTQTSLTTAPKLLNKKSRSVNTQPLGKLATHLPMKLGTTKDIENPMDSSSFETSNLKSTNLKRTSFESPNLKTESLTTSNFNSLNSIKAKKAKPDRTWIYIASSVLAVTLGAVLINQNSDSSRSYEPNRTQGF